MPRRPFLSAAVKFAPHSSERVVSPEETLSLARRTAASMGVTRVSDITGLDRIGIPVFSAVVPKSDDIISVYNGKGVCPIDALVGALMEAIERQTALYSEIAIVEDSYARLRARETAILDPRSFNHRMKTDYAEERPYCWTCGYDWFRMSQYSCRQSWVDLGADSREPGRLFKPIRVMG